MKRLGIGIVVILVLALLLCQRKEWRTAEKARTASSESPWMLRDEVGSPSAGGKPTKVRQRPEQPKVAETPVAKTPVAKPVKGRPGFVYNPFDDGILDVRGIPAGTMAQYGMAPFFIVPKMGYIITPEESMKPMSAGGVMSVSCRPIYTEPRWDDGSPVMPGDMRASLKGAQ